MKTFKDLEFIDTEGETIRSRISFDNGWGASVIKGQYSYGGRSGLYELAVLDYNGEISYDSGITSDVFGHLTTEDVTEILIKIQKLYPPKVIARDIKLEELLNTDK